MMRRAQCCCGQCVVELKGEPAIHSVCNCNNCKRRTGSAFGMSAYFHEENFRIIQGDTQTYTLNNELGAQERHFCPCCGTTLFWKAEVYSGMMGVASGCFTENSLPPPQYNVMKDNQFKWIKFADSMNNPLTLDHINKAMKRPTQP